MIPCSKGDGLGSVKMHYSDVIMGWLRLKSPASRLWTQPFIQAQIKENIIAPRHWPLCGESTGDRWIPAERASNTENVSMWWRHHVDTYYHGAVQQSMYTLHNIIERRNKRSLGNTSLNTVPSQTKRFTNTRPFNYKYRQFSNIRRTQSQNINVSRLVLSLSLPNPLKPGVKLRMKM